MASVSTVLGIVMLSIAAAAVICQTRVKEGRFSCKKPVSYYSLLRWYPISHHVRSQGRSYPPFLSPVLFYSHIPHFTFSCFSCGITSGKSNPQLYMVISCDDSHNQKKNQEGLILSDPKVDGRTDTRYAAITICLRCDIEL